MSEEKVKSNKTVCVCGVEILSKNLGAHVQSEKHKKKVGLLADNGGKVSAPPAFLPTKTSEEVALLRKEVEMNNEKLDILHEMLAEVLDIIDPEELDDVEEEPPVEEKKE